MKEYTIKVFYTVVDTVKVFAEDEFDAHEAAREISFNKSLNDMEVVDVECFEE